MVFMKRRSLLTGLGAGLLLSTRVRALRAAVPRDLEKNPVFKVSPFQLGVASGDPASDGWYSGRGWPRTRWKRRAAWKSSSRFW